jgi:hypothetical protein
MPTLGAALARRISNHLLNQAAISSPNAYRIAHTIQSQVQALLPIKKFVPESWAVG